MRAIVYDRYGPPEVLRLAEIPKPVPKDDEILIRVSAVTVNRTDCGFRTGQPWVVRFWSGVRRPKQPILGNELAGEIEAVGAKVMTFKAGDEVCGLTGNVFGAHAEYVCLPADAAIVLKPSHLPAEQAVALWDGPWLGLACVRAASVAHGQHILVYGASGSIGSSAVQLAELVEARQLRPLIDRTYPLAQIVDAYRYVDTEQKTGSVVILIAT